MSRRRFRVPVPQRFVLFLASLSIVTLFILLSWIGIIPIGNLFVYMVSVALFWTLITMFGILGGIALGMLLSHRILSIGGFTPFEEEMLSMRADILDLRERLGRIEDRLAGKGGG